MKYPRTYRRALGLLLLVVSVCSASTALALSQKSFWGKLTWDTAIAGEGETRFRYGNWYGPGWWGGSELANRAGGLPPVDALDAVAQKHDFGYEVAEKLGRGNKRLEAHYKALADIIAVRDTLALPSDPKLWKPPARDPGLARKYRERIALGFPNYQQRLNQLKSAIPSRVDPSHPETHDWFLDGKPPLDEKQFEKLAAERVRTWNADYQKRKAKKEHNKFAAIPDRANTSSKAYPGQAGWKLKRVVEDDGKATAERGNKSNPNWKTEVEYSQSSATIKMTYLGPTNNEWKIPHVHGSSISMKMGWSAPTQTVFRGQEASMNVSVGLGSRSHKWPDMNGKMYVQIVKIDKDGKPTGIEIGRLYNDVQGKPRESWFESSSTNGYKSFSENIFSKLPDGSKTGDLIGIKANASMGNCGKVSTTYVYEWNAPKAPSK